MSTDILRQFAYDGDQVRALLVAGEPWFVAKDVCDVLGIATNHVREILDADEVSNLPTTEVAQNGGRKPLIVSEPGLYSLVLRSRKPEAKAFKRWVTHYVLPQIRQTGGYQVPQGRELLALAVLEADRTIKAQQQQIAELAPRASKWDAIGDAHGALTVGDVAKLLRHAGKDTGPQRLFNELLGRRWLFRAGDGRPRPMQWAIEQGLLTTRAQGPHVNRRGELVTSAPQVLVTPKGVNRLLDINELARPLLAVSA